ncbi:ICOS ligand isoform X1 [Bos indicus]|uniref:ICOS ligand isoform X1 n=1 Tax=Bos indicus TaxID=9915 RepID=A0ABM4SVC0_BOSIN
MRPRSPGLFLLLLWGLQAESQEEVRAMVGSDVQLRCIYPEKNSFDLNDLYVYWQISMAGKGNVDSVVTYHLSGNSSASHGDNHYKDRARLSLDSMKQGDFSLHLRNVTPQDEQKFNCLVFRKSLELKKILEVAVTLHVAANYSMPVVSGPSQDEELTFTCTSTNGYPRPNVYWINKTDNSVLDSALQNNTVSLNARGLYDVVSVLRIGRTPHVNVGCCIENVLLHQNLTSGQTETFTGTKDSITEDPVDGSPSGKHQQVFSVLAVLAVIVLLALATGWLCRSRCPPKSYTGAQVARPELALAGAERLEHDAPAPHPVSVPLVSLHHSPRGGALQQVQTLCTDEHLTVPTQTSRGSCPALGKYHIQGLGFRFPPDRCLGLPGPLGSRQPAPCLKPVASPL